MKITHLIYDFSPGGAERFVTDLCRVQYESGNDVTVLCVKDLGKNNRTFYLGDLPEGVVVHSIGCKGRVTPVTLIKILLYFYRDKSDIIHAHTFSNLLYLPVFLLKKKVVWTIHSLPSYYVQNFLTRNIDRFIFLKRRVVPITISQQCHAAFRMEYGLELDRMILNGRSEMVQTERFGIVRREIEGLKKNDTTPVFVHVARYDRLKNQTLLISAFNRLCEDGMDFVLLIIGPGTEKLWNEIPVSPSIHILGAKNNVGDYLSLSDYFVLSSIHEGLPLSLLEAMSKGCIPISTPAGGIIDVISNGVNGHISPSFDINDYVATIKHALLDSYVTKDKVVKEYSEKYTMKICADNYFSVYSDLQTRSR